MAVNYFSPYVSANAKLCEGEEDFEDTRTNVSVILLSSRPRRHLILSFCFGISLCFVIRFNVCMLILISIFISSKELEMGMIIFGQNRMSRSGLIVCR